MALHLLLLLLSNKGITAPALLIRFNRGTGTVRPLLLLRRTSINSRREVVGMDNKRTDSLNRVPMEDSLNRVLTVSLLPPSLSSNTVSHRLGVTDSPVQVRTDSLPPLRTVRPRLRRLMGKVRDNLQLLTDNLNLPLTEDPHLINPTLTHLRCFSASPSPPRLPLLHSPLVNSQGIQLLLMWTG